MQILRILRCLLFHIRYVDTTIEPFHYHNACHKCGHTWDN